MKRYIIFLLFVFVVKETLLFAQFTDKQVMYPQITTPNAAAFNKYIDYPVDISTGAIDVNIPVYTLKDGGIDIPIVLRYNTSGIKVREEASWVGLGWNLNVGGVITQNVVGPFDQLDKGDSDKLRADPQLQIQDHYYYNNAYTKVRYDEALHEKVEALRSSEYGKYAHYHNYGKINPDIFYFSYPGNSGKFIINPEDNQVYILNRRNNIKIEIDSVSDQDLPIGGFTITTTEGIKHVFERKSIIFSSVSNYTHTSSVSYTLCESIFPNGQSIKYNYELIDHYSYSTSHSIGRPLGKDLLSANLHTHGSWVENMFSGPSSLYEGENMQPASQIQYYEGQEFILKSIETPNYTVEFETQDREDLANSKSLKDILVKTKDNIVLNKFTLDYEYFISNTPSESHFWKTIYHEDMNDPYYLKRLKLTALHEGIDQKDKKSYKFEYNESNFPRKNTFAVDYWGYYNEMNGNKSLLPDLKELFYFNSTMKGNKMRDISVLSSHKSNRGANSEHIISGMLSKVFFPTGGHQEFEYEANSFCSVPVKIASIELPAKYPYSSPSGSRPDHFLLGSEGFQYQNIALQAVSNISLPNLEQTEFMLFNNLDVDIQIKINRGSGKTWDEILPSSGYGPYIEFTHKDNPDYSYRISDFKKPEAQSTELILTKNLPLKKGTYTVKASSTKFSIGDSYAGSSIYASFFIPKAVEPPAYSIGSGLRIKRISLFDKADNDTPSLVKEYDYTNPATGLTSGHLYEYPIFTKLYRNQSTLIRDTNEIDTFAKYFSFSFDAVEVWSNNAITTTYSSSPPLVYSHVRETQKIDKESSVGSILYKFHIGESIYRQDCNRTDDPLTAQLTEKIVYNAEGKTLEKEQYKRTATNIKNIKSINAIDNYSRYYSYGYSTYPTIHYLDYYSDQYAGDRIDLLLEKIKSYDIVLSSKEIYKDGIITKEEYNYNSSTLQLQKKKVVLNENKNLVYNYTYPYDFALGNNVYQQMVTKNMISPVVEQTTTHNDKEIGKIKTEYTSDANKTKGLILPGYVQTSSNGDSRTDVTYDRYDTKGNILQYTTFDGVSTTYLWSYKGQYPVAEIKNASYEEVTNALTGTTPEAISALDKPDMTPIDGLRNKLPHALVTTYTYKPLVGMTSMTDPAGVKTIYTYDDFGRLKETLIEEGGKQNPVNTYQYHYRTSSEP